MRWSSATDAIIAVGQAAVDVLWIHACFQTFAAADPDALNPGFFALFLLPVGAIAAIRGAALLPFPFPWNRVLLLPISLVVLAAWLHLLLAPEAGWSLAHSAALLTRPESVDPQISFATLFAGWVVALLLWCRGLWIGLRRPDLEAASMSLLFGIAVFVALLAMVSSASNPRIQELAPALRSQTLAFFSIGLTVTALVHAQSLGRRLGQRQRLSGSWLVALVTPVAALSAIGLLLSGRLMPVLRQTLDSAMDLAAAAWQAGAWAAYWFSFLLLWISRLLPAPGPTPPRDHPDPPPPRPVVRRPASAAEPLRIDDPGFWIALAVLCALGALLVFLVLRALRRRRDSEAKNEERSSLWSWSLFFAQLGGVWRSARTAAARRLGRRGPIAVQPPAPEDDLDLAEIRQVFRRLLRWAEGRGWRRSPCDTPIEFANELVTARPDLQAPVRIITATYMRARYGGEVIASDEIAVVQSALDEVQVSDALGGHGDGQLSRPAGASS